MTRFRNRGMLALALLALTTLFTVTSAHAQYSVISSFDVPPGPSTANPVGAIAQGEDGALYSTAVPDPGSPIDGQVYKVTTSGTGKVLATFCSGGTGCPNGFSSVSGLTLRPDGHFLGTTMSNSPTATGFGTIFDISAAGTLTTVYSFTGEADGGFSQSAPIVGPDGQFYGVTSSSNVSCGTIYRLTTVPTVIHTFLTAAKKQNGCNPYSALVLGTDGNFYGTTPFGGPNGYGTVYKVTYRPGQSTLFTVLAAFNSTTGPAVGALVEGNDGNFYGMTSAGFYSETGVTDQGGTIFQVTPSGVLTVVHVFDGKTDGADPVAGLTLATDGNFYGTAATGGTNSGGTLFQFTPTFSFSVLHNFGSVSGDGFNPSGLVQHTNGQLYGVTNSGGVVEGLSYGCSIDINTGCGVFFGWNGSLPAFVSSVQPMGAVGSTVEILGQGFTSTSTVSFNGVSASATVQSATSLIATVPAGATTGNITVTTSSGTLTSNRQFIVLP
jgi:uncharacterized repeat protein (TIGR03803 family)